MARTGSAAGTSQFGRQLSKIAPIELKQILYLQAEGHTNLTIAQRLGLDRHTVGRHAAPMQTRIAATQLGIVLDEARLRYLLAGLKRPGICLACSALMFCCVGAPAIVCNSCGESWATAKRQA